MNDSTQKIAEPHQAAEEERISVKVRDLDLFYDGDVQALDKIKLDIPDRQVTAFIGPSG